ncbi:hypothetical protein HYU16_00825 [Candidatus Woesearchaeota archaeon]|nr:hypothetical protein [Candidatus Woesearchaeota archaeon]
MPLDDVTKKAADEIENALITRREFVRRAWIYVSFGGLAALAAARGDLLESGEREQEIAQLKGEESPAAKYAPRIIVAARRLLSRIEDFDYYDRVIGATLYTGAIVGAELTMRRDKKLPPRQFSEKTPQSGRILARTYSTLWDVYRARKPSSTRRLLLLSAGAALVSRIADNFSTVRVAQALNDPRFIRYGINRYMPVHEKNLLLGARPTPEEVINRRNLLLDFVAVMLSYFSPMLGFSIALSGPFVYLNNRGIERTLQVAYMVGDSVDVKLKAGASDGEIRNYLRNVTLEDLAKQEVMPAPKTF